MSNPVVTEHRGPVRRHLVRALLSLGAGAVLACWLLFSWVLWALRCGDNCSGDDAQHWRWGAQLVLAAVGSLSGASALVLGFTSWTRAYRVLLWLCLGCGLVWVAWVMGGQGGF
jgi:hypothetical protein